MSTHIETPIAENSDFTLKLMLVGEDGETPLEEDGVVTAITMSLRDITGGVMIATDRDVLSGLTAVVTDPVGDYNFATPLTAEDNRVIEGSGELQLRLITLKVTHSGGKKRNQEFTYHLDAMQDVEDTVVP
jgi:hypothetical protein